MTPLVWIDTETTGLQPDQHVVLEVACVITNERLAVLACYEAVIWQAPEHLDRMNPFVRDMHTKNGLLALVPSGKEAYKVQNDVADLILSHCGFQGGTLAGNTCHFDHRFMERHLPLIPGMLHYRQFDTSAIKRASAILGHGEAPKSTSNHRAMSDVLASIEEWRWYTENVFKDVRGPQDRL